MNQETSASPGIPAEKPHAKPRRGWFRRLFSFTWKLLLFIVIICAIVRPFLPRVVRYYVNRTLSQSPLYSGRIGDVELHLYRGAYSIHDVKISKTTGNVPVPFFAAKTVDLSIEWRALLHRKVVGQVKMIEPEVNFVSDPAPGTSQTGDGGPWLKIIRDLFPFDINSFRIQNGSVHFRTYQKEKPVDVYLSKMEMQIDDLTNVDNKITPLLTTVNANANAMDQAKFEMHMKVNPFSYKPTFQLGLRLLNLDVTRTNALVETYGQFTIKHGYFDLVLDIDCDEGNINGYVKPLFRQLIIFDLSDLKDDDPLRAMWTALVGGTTYLVTNWNRDQFGTLIPFTGSTDAPNVDFLGTLGNMLRNAFIRAYLPRLEKTMVKGNDDIHFGAPSLTDPISVGNEP